MKNQIFCRSSVFCLKVDELTKVSRPLRLDCLSWNFLRNLLGRVAFIEWCAWNRLLGIILYSNGCHCKYTVCPTDNLVSTLSKLQVHLTDSAAEIFLNLCPGLKLRSEVFSKYARPTNKCSMSKHKLPPQLFLLP